MPLADLFCRLTRRRVAQTFDAVTDNDDRDAYRLAQQVLAGDLTWLEHGALQQQW
jgi:hypothetical protein